MKTAKPREYTWVGEACVVAAPAGDRHGVVTSVGVFHGRVLVTVSHLDGTHTVEFAGKVRLTAPPLAPKHTVPLDAIPYVEPKFLLGQAVYPTRYPGPSSGYVAGMRVECLRDPHDDTAFDPSTARWEYLVDHRTRDGEVLEWGWVEEKKLSATPIAGLN